MKHSARRPWRYFEVIIGRVVFWAVKTRETDTDMFKDQGFKASVPPVYGVLTKAQYDDYAAGRKWQDPISAPEKRFRFKVSAELVPVDKIKSE